MYAAELARNENLKEEIRKAAAQGMPVYAECGGLMYLGERVRDFESQEHAMVGAIPLSTRIDGRRLSLGYRTIKALEDSPILRRGEIVRGHEFHWSILEKDSAANAYEILDRGPRREGFLKQQLLASYIHLHFGSLPSMAPRFVEKCREFGGIQL